MTRAIAPLGGEAYLDEMMGRFASHVLSKATSSTSKMLIFGGLLSTFGKRLTGAPKAECHRCTSMWPAHLSQIFGIMNKERAMTKTLVALVLIAGGILLVTRR